jgi:Protein of unknown function (DUF1559)
MAMSAAKHILIVAAILMALIAFWLFFLCPEASIDQDYMRTSWCIKEIGRAFHDFHAEHGRLPPAVVAGKDGVPLYSWRVLLLPYLEEDPVYRAFRLDEPWDSPHNQKFLGYTPGVFLHRAEHGWTHFQIITGPGTAFERPGLTWKDFPDGLPDTMLLVEARDPVPWTKPADLVYDPNGPLPPFGDRDKKRRYWRCLEISVKSGFVAGFADGSSRFIPTETDEKIVRAMMTRNGGEQVGAGDLK